MNGECRERGMVFYCWECIAFACLGVKREKNREKLAKQTKCEAHTKMEGRFI